MQEEKPLHLDVPFLSIRRHSLPPPTTSTSAVPFYKSDLKSGPVRNPGAVPFVWEQKPGQPKTAASPPPPPDEGTPSAEEDEFSDAVDTLSRAESFMDCSLGGVPDAGPPSERLGLEVRGLMMGRFLPAAQAMAGSGSPKRRRARFVERVEFGPLPYQHRPRFVAPYPRDDGIDSSDDDDGDDDEIGLSKACGLLPRFCVKSSAFCLLNPMIGMKVGGRDRRRRISGVLHNDAPLSQAENELWEAVCKHKLRPGIPLQGDGERKNTSKCNHDGQWSDSLTLDESSSCCHSGGSREALPDILKRDANNGKSDGSESFDKDGFLSPTMANSVLVDSGLMAGIPLSKHSSIDSDKDFIALKKSSKFANVVSEVIVDNQRMEENLGLHSNSNLRSILLPPLPKTPSESWLLRTLPVVSAKIPPWQSNLGKKGFLSSSAYRQESDAKPLESQYPPVPCVVAKQGILCKPSMLHQCQITPTEHSEESRIKCSEPKNDQILDMKPSKPPRRQIRFADVLMTPLSPRSEM